MYCAYACDCYLGVWLCVMCMIACWSIACVRLTFTRIHWLVVSLIRVSLVTRLYYKAWSIPELSRLQLLRADGLGTSKAQNSQFLGTRMHHHDPPTCHPVSTWQNQHARKRYKTKNYWSKMAEVANQSHRSPATRFFLAGDLGTNGCPCCPSRKMIWKATLDWPTVHCHPPRHIPWHPYI